MVGELFNLLGNEAQYKPSVEFWNDAHISKGLLEAHLNAGWDAASRKHRFIDRSALWIAEIAPLSTHQALLDLGCGPGLYTERFSDLGYTVTGMDFSKRSIEYAAGKAAEKQKNIEYRCSSYLEMDFYECFDVITIIYCDYGALPDAERKTLRDKAFFALRHGGKFILDCFSPVYFEKTAQENSFEYCDSGGFWNEDRYLVLNTTLRDNESMTLQRKHLVLTETDIKCYSFRDSCFSKDRLEREITGAGFTNSEFFSDVAGKPFSGKSETVCGVFTK